MITALESHQIEEVAGLFHDVWHETQAPLQDPRKAQVRDLAFFRKRIEERAARTLVSIVDGEIAGFACWTGNVLNSLFVKQKFRNAGVGSALLVEAERAMAQAGAKAGAKAGADSFQLDCVEGNHVARKFYEHHGWRVADKLQSEDQTSFGPLATVHWLMVKP